MATSTTPAQAATNGQTTRPLRAPLLVTPKGRRRPGLMVVGIALALVGALVSVWLVASAGQRTGVVVVARDVPYGATLSAQDLTITDVFLDPSIASIPSGDAASLVGQVAAVGLVAGSVLAPGQVMAAGPPAPDEVIVPLALTPSRIPAGGLVAGDRLLVVDTPPEQADPPSAEPATFEVTVARVGPPDLNGVVVVDVVATTGDGPDLAARAATGRFSLVVQPPGADS
ncbi:SAF domain-containing protein [Cellulomonas hominis]